VVGVSDRKQFRDLASPEAAREAIDSLELSPDSETVPLSAARGRVLAERVDADLDVPGFDRASVDGYAVRGRDTFGADEADPVTLELVGTVHAGAEPEAVVGTGEAAEISTGAVLPDGADAVVMVERTEELDGGSVATRNAVAPGDNVMLAGTDIAAGARALGPGTRLTSREIGLLSALGIDEVPVRGRPTVGIVSTGDELVRPGGDLVLSSGSTSASAVDVIYRVIEDRGELLLHGVAVKPGKPMLIGELGGGAYVGLPGYPVSALTIFRTFVAPAIRAAAGLPEPETATVRGRMAVRERYGEGRLRLMPAGLVTDADGEPLVYPVDKGSGATTSLVDADGVVAVDPDTEYLGAGDAVEVQLFSPDVRPPTLLAVGEDDPALSRLLDHLASPRFLPVGSREGLRRLRGGVPDVAVAAGPTDRDVDSVDLGGWSREWGLVVPDGNPAGITGLADLIDRDLGFVNRSRDAGIRASLDAAVEDVAEDRGMSRSALTDSIRGFGVGTKGVESPARAVARGDADAGLGLSATAASLGLGFVPLGVESVRVRANPDRVGKPSLEELDDALGNLGPILDGLAGYDPE
jgi:molybdopterin biosynthesis enzyme/molybdate-binding protein